MIHSTKFTILLAVVAFANVELNNSSENEHQTKENAEEVGSVGAAGVGLDAERRRHEKDPNGYLLFCLCMGRVGNQVEHFLGGLAFAKSINRTLILPSFRTYVGNNKNIPFNEWFQIEPLTKYHRVILAEEFMEHYADDYWPANKRFGFCYGNKNNNEDCKMKEGNPFGPFWDGLGVNFVKDVKYQMTYSNEFDRWAAEFPAAQYPVISMKGAPATFPMDPSHWHLQKYLIFSDQLKKEADDYINKHFPQRPFIGLHLRNGPDWENACQGAVGTASYMASPQCLQGTNDLITKNMCLPSTAEVLRLTKNLVITQRIKVVFVATDKYPLLKELKEHLSNKNVDVFHADPWLPLVDWAILVRSNYFIGNCVSSFTSFVTRARNVDEKPTYFWGYSKV
ncbi:hypothetical protein HELRODRAFT_170340 [Helobdella robusta]|uniref:GDP-fucose protein O-fucosyltransferase 1 n=1 Tax=Helobdella robusta TaxID=6412 RepID=T1F2X9_HELRO|nr:hypothetical protein HELRODRAFT_170340 [Helobdella robusta]ESO07787.1 hypothetical protein HELRODRAFT_170340 [Helobdella robusta]